MLSFCLVYLSLFVFIWSSIAVQSGTLNKQDIESFTNPAACEVNLQPDTSDLAGTDYASHVQSARLIGGRTYRYVLYKPTEKKPYLLFLHGFPSTSYDWRRQFKYFSELGYGIVAPDLLGYGGTDKPSDLQSYRLKPMAQEVIELLDCVGAEKVLTISHDWGSLLQSRVVTYHRERLLAATFLDIGYSAQPLGIGGSAAKAINLASKLALGYPIFGYWFLFNEANASQILDAHPESASTLMYANDPAMQKYNFCDGETLRTWLLSNKTAPPSPWMPPNELKIFDKIMSKNGGYEGGLHWYKAIVNNINDADESLIATAETQIGVPVLLITAKKDPIGLPSIARSGTKKYAKDFTEKSVDSGHFVQLEKSEEVNGYLKEFFDKVLRSGSGTEGI